MNRIDVGGSTNGTQQGFTVYGTSGQVRANIEGINATEATGAFGNYPDVGAMEEVQINTAAHSAEASTPGVQSQFISKSGGNEYRGTFFGGYSNERWQAHNIDADQIARGLRGGGGIAAEDVNLTEIIGGTPAPISCSTSTRTPTRGGDGTGGRIRTTTAGGIRARKARWSRVAVASLSNRWIPTSRTPAPTRSRCSSSAR